jgi:hypothetical protein
MTTITIEAKTFVEKGDSREIGRISVFGEYEKVRRRLRHLILLKYPKLDFFTIKEYKS